VTVFIGLLGAVIGGVVGAVATYFTTRSNMRLGLEHEYDRTLRDQRLKAYQGLYHLTRQIPRHWLLTPVPARSELLKIRTSFHDWYYGEEAHGMFLARDSKKAYINLQNALDEALFVKSVDGLTKTENRADTPLADDELHRLLWLSSELRHQLVADVGASNPPGTRSTHPEPTVMSAPSPPGVPAPISAPSTPQGPTATS
jgi:hypothetical protein